MRPTAAMVSRSWRAVRRPAPQTTGFRLCRTRWRVLQSPEPRLTCECEVVQPSRGPGTVAPGRARARVKVARSF